LLRLFVRATTCCVVLWASACAILKMPYVMRELVKFIDEKENVLECRRTSASKRSRPHTASRYITSLLLNYCSEVVILIRVSCSSTMIINTVILILLFSHLCMNKLTTSLVYFPTTLCVMPMPSCSVYLSVCHVHVCCQNE